MGRKVSAKVVIIQSDAIKKLPKQQEGIFLRRLSGMLPKMAKADGKVDDICPSMVDL